MYKRYQKKFDHSYCLGSFPTIELLRNKSETAKEILVHSRFAEPINEGYNIIKDLAEKKAIDIRESDKNIEKISAKSNCYVVAIFEKYSDQLINDNHLVLVNPQNRGNLGTILRSMLAFGIKNMAVIEPAVDYFDPDTVRASMGALFSINIKAYQTIEDYRIEFPNNHIYPMMTDGEYSLTNLTLKQPYSTVFGSESSGLSEPYKTIGQTIKIAHNQEVDSLNLSIAVGITLHHQMVHRK